MVLVVVVMEVVGVVEVSRAVVAVISQGLVAAD